MNHIEVIVIESLMPLDEVNVRALPGKLLKSLKKLRKDSSAERVHQFRTRTRRMEAAVHALGLDSRRNEKRFLKAIKPVRKKAGKVRDMDVLTEFASSVAPTEQQCGVSLLEHLGSERATYSRKLQKLADENSTKISKRLKKCSRLIEDELDQQANADDNAWSTNAAAVALQLEGELRAWPALNRRNLHPFRLKVKELRYVLQLAAHQHGEFVSALGEVKDSVGEWHDWEELAGIAKEVIQHRRCRLLEEIRSTSEKKFEHALSLANGIRKRYLSETTSRAGTKPARRKSPRSAEPVLQSASALAA